MKALALVILFSVAANSQYPIQAERGAKVKQSRLSELSPRAGPDRPRPTSVPISVLAPLTAFGGLGGEVTIPQNNKPTANYIQTQVLGLGSRRVGVPAYELTPTEGTTLAQLHKQHVQSGHGYAVEEPSQEEPHEQTSEGYQLVLQRVPSKIQPQETQRLGNPIVEEYYESSQLQDHQPILFRSPQQNIQQHQELYSSPISIFQTQGEPQQVFPQQQQFYAQKPSIQFIQGNPSITTADPLPPSNVHVTSINPPRYQTTTEAIFPEVGQQNSGGTLHKDVPSYGVTTPTSYAQPPQYYSFQLNEQQQELIDSRSEPVSFFQNQVQSQTTTSRPGLSISSVIPVNYQPHTPQPSGNVGVPEGIYDSNGALIALRSGGRAESPQGQQPFRLVSYIPQQYLEGSSNIGASYNENQGQNLRNPVEYASPFARQELLELRQKKNV